MRYFWRILQVEQVYKNDEEQFLHSHILPYPINMMIAKYTQMNKTTSIFDSTAGSGALLVGTNPKVTHANETCVLKRTTTSSRYNQLFL
ncbi:hypothetical protein IMCC3317_40350 [Kordia antarctica]|uniref:DNA methylase adenine-specific domain-containing protein n=1 Tax=Kordia antarctica TaxID=1218801 RepID=A0A7L4ZQ39_9FLAO|nr:hypothetical protein [Kordia antarctica]QHI38641.1 hypothetical protein IMCC3317_40350 [Kordia antarctica]